MMSDSNPLFISINFFFKLVPMSLCILYSMLFPLQGDANVVEVMLFPKGLENVEDIVNHIHNLHNTKFNILIGGLQMKPSSKS